MPRPPARISLVTSNDVVTLSSDWHVMSVVTTWTGCDALFPRCEFNYDNTAPDFTVSDAHTKSPPPFLSLFTPIQHCCVAFRTMAVFASLFLRLFLLKLTRSHLSFPSLKTCDTLSSSSTLPSSFRPSYEYFSQCPCKIITRKIFYHPPPLNFFLQYLLLVSAITALAPP